MNKEERKDKIFYSVFIVVVIIFVSFLMYYWTHPKSRNVSYYNNDNYYMVNAITGNNESSPDNWHFGAIKKEDYNSWKNGTATTVWVVSPKDITRGWRLRCNTISTIIIYDREHLPLRF